MSAWIVYATMTVILLLGVTKISLLVCRYREQLKRYKAYKKLETGGVK